MGFLSVIWIYILVAFLTNHLSLFALNFDVVLEVLWVESETTSLRTWSHLLVARVNMFHSFFVLVLLATVLVAAFKLETVQFLFSKPMDRSILDSLVTLTLLRAMIIALCPWFQAFLAEKCITALTFQWVLDNHRTNNACEEVGSFPFFFIYLNHVRQI